jgi:hypothetical protein
MRVRCRAAPRCVTSQAGFEPALPVSDVSEIFTTSVGLAARCGKPKNKKIHLRRVNDAPLLRTSKKVRSVIGIRLAPRSLRQAPRSWARASAARAPGSGSPVPAFKPGNFKRALLRTIKNPPELLAREGPLSGLSNSLTRDRSHEPGVRHRPANNRSIVRRAFHICGSSQGSCSFANLIVCKGAGDTPARCRCQAADRRNVATDGAIVRRM